MLLGVCAADYVGGAKPAPTNAPSRISAPFCLGAAGVCASPSASQLEGEGAQTHGFRFTSIDRSDDSVALGLSWSGADFTTSPFIEVFSRTNLIIGEWRYAGWLQANSGETNVSVVVDADMLDADARSPTLFFSALADEWLSDDGSDDDGDGVPNVTERARGTNPRRTDSDGDGISDAGELDFVSAGAAIPELDVSSLPDAFAGTMTLAAYPAAISVNLPFAVEIAGGSSTQAIVHTCGVVTFPDVESLEVPRTYTYDDTPAILYADQHAVVSAYGFQFTMLGYVGAELRAGTIYTSNGRWFVAEWRDMMDMMEFASLSFGRATFQLAVSEADPATVYVRYLSLSGSYDGTSAIIGAHGLNGRQELLVANDEPGSVSAGMTLTYHWGRGTDPLNPDSDGDGLPDGWEVAYGMDPLVHSGTLADPRFAPDADPDRDQLTNRREAELGTNPFQPDSDGDGMEDGWENRHRAWGFNPVVANANDEILKTGPDDDLDGDGLSNARECAYGTSPGDTDTDGDRVGDAEEVSQLSDPADATDGGLPASRVPVTFVFGDPSVSHSEKYRLELTPVAPTNRTVAPSEIPRSVAWVNARYGACETNTALLKPGWKYKVELHHAGTDPEYNGNPNPDYDYLLECDASYGVARAIVDDPEELFGSHQEDGRVYTGSGKTACLYVLGTPLIVFDYDRDRRIDDADVENAKDGKTFRFWANDDDDSGDVCSGTDYCSDEPGRFANYTDDWVNGRRDLLDFTPAWIDFSGVFPPDTPKHVKENLEWRLRSDCVKVVWTNFSREDAGAFQRSDKRGCGEEFLQYAYEAKTVELDGDNGILPQEFLELALGSERKGVFLIEGRNGRDGLVLEGVGGLGNVSVRSEAPLAVSTVEDMYRWLNLRSAGGDAGGLASRLNSPRNRPDGECDGRQFVFVHGFNVNTGEARASAAEVFKRLWQSGSESMFTAVEWHGDQDQTDLVEDIRGTISLNYYANALHAFETASALAASCTNLPGRKVMIAHSLGNVLVSSAAVDHNLDYDRYYMLNAAVAMEAYDRAELSEDMVDSNWATNDVPLAYRASRWSGLFGSDDFRSTLSWRGRFAGIRNAVNCYSETEDVVGNPRHAVLTVNEPVWVMQEYMKGTSLIHGANLLPPFPQIVCEGGWGRNAHYPLWCVTGSMLGLSALTREDVIENPLFTPFRNESERMNSTNLFPVADAAATPQLRARFLADAIPAESHAAGANAFRKGVVDDNIRMDTSVDNGCMANVDRWPRDRVEEIEDDDGNVVGKILRWEHSDLKNLAYFFVYRLFDRIVR